MVSDFTRKVISQYLFGQETKPQNILTDEVIRSASTVTIIKVPLPDFMTNGAGQYAYAANSNFLHEFFDPTNTNHLELLDIDAYLVANNDNIQNHMQQNGTYSFSKDIVEKAYIFKFGEKPDFSFDFQHYWYRNSGETDLQFAERVFLWNSAEFTYGQETQFIYTSTGDTWLDNFSIVPIQLVDKSNDKIENFDFTSTDTAAGFSGGISRARLDISDIGRRVDFQFTGSANLQTFTQSDFQASIDAELAARRPIFNVVQTQPKQIAEAIAALELLPFIKLVYQELFNEGPADFYDESNRPILYGTLGNDVINEDSAKFDFEDGILGVIFDSSYEINDFIKNGLVVFGGDGNDNITGGTASDSLNGNAGEDQLYGGEGDDELYGGADGDFLDGGDGKDELFGGDGNDRLNGGNNETTNENDLVGDLLDGGLGWDRYAVNEVRNATTIAHIDQHITPDELDESIRDVIDTVVDEDGIGRIGTFSGGNWGLLADSDNNASQAGGLEPAWAFGTTGEAVVLLGAVQYYATLIGGSDMLIMERIYNFQESRTEFHGVIILKDFKNGDFGFNFDGFDKIHEGTDGNDDIDGGAEDDQINGNDGDDNLNGDEGNDNINGGAGNDNLDGGAGNDQLTGGSGTDTYDGGTGIDTAIFEDAPAAANVNLTTGVATDGYGNTEKITNGHLYQ